MNLTFSAETLSGRRALEARIDDLVIAGWTGRNAAAVEAHIAELERLGVKRPATTPIFYRVASSLLTTNSAIEVAGPDTSGEVEPVLVSVSDGLFVGIGSDHTDRKAETQGVTLAKQLCAKPISGMLWPYGEVAPHWDRLTLRSWATVEGSRRLYQEGPVSTLRAAPELMARYLRENGILPHGTVMFCGTLAVHGGIVPADRFEIELIDPVLGRQLEHAYDVRALPVAG